ncbi:MAG TPA: hypothetical protein VNS58_12580 [Puia sp.]|nr:hypothetical protein [Puia sp.]
MADFVINKTIRIASQFDSNEDIAGETTPPAISYRLFYPVENGMPLMTGILAGANRQIVQCVAANGFIINGDLVTEVSTDEMILRGNLFYGFSGNYALQNHFEGTIAIFPLNTPPDPPFPSGPAENTDDFADDIAIDAPGNMAIDAPLFPYLYIQPWPKGTVREWGLNFINYDVATAPAGSLYSLLVPKAQVKDRAAMEKLALLFVQNEVPFTDQYYFSLLNVPVPFDGFPGIYDLLLALDALDTYETVLLTRLSYENADELKALISPGNKVIIDQVWQNYFALTIITGYDEALFINLNKILLVWNIIQKLYTEPYYLLLDSVLVGMAEVLRELLHATVILPGIPTVPAGQTEPVFPLPPYQQAIAPTTKNWIEPYAIGQLKMARYRLLRYQQGEVAQIQNVLKGEKKKIVNRSLTNTGEQTVLFNNDSSESSSEGREATGELLVETQKTVAALTKKIKYDKLTTTYGPPTQAVLDGSYSEDIVPNSPSKEDRSNFTSLVLNKTLNRINETVLKSRTGFRYTEKEEIASSIFNNTSGAGHFRGIYRWVNKVYRISVHNYGCRFLLELHIDNPAADFIASQEIINNINLAKPVSPAQQQPQNIKSFTDITIDNYVVLLSYYQVAKIVLPPEPAASASITLNAGETEKYIAIPAGYTATSAVITGQIAAGASLTAITGIIGTVAFSVASGTTENKTLNNETGQVTIAVIGSVLRPQPQVEPPVLLPPPVQPENFILNATINCTVTDKKLNEWKVIIYDAITEAYEKMMAAYNNSITRFAMDDQQTNPLLLNNIEKSCLYRSCMAMILNITAAKTGSRPDIIPPLLTVNRQRYVQFAEDAFEWDEMTYRFDDQPSKLSYSLQGKDDSLRPFLQAGSAVVFLPVRPGYNFHLLYYLSAGIIWGTHYPFVPVNDTDIQTAAHIKKIRYWDEAGKEEKHWNITLPTAMQVVQESDQLPDYTFLK